MPILDKSVQKDFLEKDLYDALRWLLVGAVAWKAAPTEPDRYGHQCVLAMLTTFVQARALYEFFYATGKGDDARAAHFAYGWNEPKSAFYSNYMNASMPANKRVFHLVYDRGQHSGGMGSRQLKEQVLNFASDLLNLTERFIQRVEPDFRNSAQYALDRALAEAQSAADYYGIGNPFVGP